jgi:DNA-binding transcriptional ArsR family regulator
MNFDNKQPGQKSWWGPIWRGLVADATAKHYRAMRASVWLFLYLVIHADRKTGKLSRRYETIAQDTGLNKRTVRSWLLRLRRQGYVKVERAGGSVAIYIQIEKWKPLRYYRGK